MFGKLKSAKTKEEWGDFLENLYDKDKYLFGLEIYQHYPLGKEVLKQINYLVNIDVTFLLDENGKITYIVPNEEINNYKKKQLKRMTVFKETLENKDEIETLNLKYHLLTTTLEQIYALLNFNKTNISTKEDSKVYRNYSKKIKIAKSKEEWVELEIKYANYVHKRFLDLHPNYEAQLEYIIHHFALLHQMIILAKDGNENVIQQLNDAEEMMSTFKGNPIEKRKKDNFKKYKTVITLIKCMETHFKAFTGVQKKACEMVGVIPNSFSKWKSENNGKYWKIFNELTKKDLIKYRKEIKQKYL